MSGADSVDSPTPPPNVPDPPRDATGQTIDGAYSPMVPKPMIVAISGLVASLLAFNVVYDAFSDDYEGLWVTFLLGSIILVVYGVPFGIALKALRP